LAASTADCLFATGASKEQSRGIYSDIKGRLAKYGRRNEDLKILPGLLIYVGESAQEAEDYYQGLQALIPPDLGLEYLSKTLEMDMSRYPIDGPVPELIGEKVGGIATRALMAEYAHRNKLTIRQTYEHVVGSMGGLIIKGSVNDVCDQMEDWFKSGVCDGFVLSGPVMPDGMRRIMEMVVPELQRRGVFRKDVEEGKTLRESLGLERPKNQFFEASS
jgi:alkanesulfonate monooxygenase